MEADKWLRSRKNPKLKLNFGLRIRYQILITKWSFFNPPKGPPTGGAVQAAICQGKCVDCNRRKDTKVLMKLQQFHNPNGFLQPTILAKSGPSDDPS